MSADEQDRNEGETSTAFLYAGGTIELRVSEPRGRIILNSTDRPSRVNQKHSGVDMEQMTIFSASPTVSSVPSSAELRDQGMARALDHAEAIHEGWILKAKLLLSIYLNTQETEFTCEDFRCWARLPEPPDRRSFGSIIRGAAVKGMIRKVGYRNHRDPSRHNGVSTLWQKSPPLTGEKS